MKRQGSQKTSPSPRPTGNATGSPRPQRRPLAVASGSPQMQRRGMTGGRTSGPSPGPGVGPKPAWSPGSKRRTNATSPRPGNTKTPSTASGRRSAGRPTSRNARVSSKEDTVYPQAQTEHDIYNEAVKKQSAEIKETVVVTSPTADLSVPKQSRKQDGGGKQDGDNLSETGTYTIESDAVSKEIEDARKSIDQVFGVGAQNEADNLVAAGAPGPLVDNNGNIEMADTDEDDVGEELPHDSAPDSDKVGNSCLMIILVHLIGNWRMSLPIL